MGDHHRKDNGNYFSNGRLRNDTLARPDIRQEDIDAVGIRAPIGYAGSGAKKRFGARAGSKRVRESTLLCSGLQRHPPVCIFALVALGIGAGG